MAGSEETTAARKRRTAVPGRRSRSGRLPGGFRGPLYDPAQHLARGAKSPESFLVLKAHFLDHMESDGPAKSRKSGAAAVQVGEVIPLDYPTTIWFQSSSAPGSVFVIDVDTDRIIRNVLERPWEKGDASPPEVVDREDRVDQEFAVSSSGPTPGSDEYLERLSEPHRLLKFASQLLLEAEGLEQKATGLIERARDAGATWAEIGDALGIRPQAAHQRFAPGAKERHAERQRRRRESS